MKPEQFGVLITSLVVSVPRKWLKVIFKKSFNTYINKRFTHRKWYRSNVTLDKQEWNL